MIERCPRCKAPVHAHCSNPVCTWQTCPQKNCQTIVDTKDGHWYSREDDAWGTAQPSE
jgi:hypothetical protein